MYRVTCLLDPIEKTLKRSQSLTISDGALLVNELIGELEKFIDGGYQASISIGSQDVSVFFQDSSSPTEDSDVIVDSARSDPLLLLDIDDNVILEFANLILSNVKNLFCR
uniref:PCNA_N domain-containing protein n=1 Tax=Rhabditophanes sp. KR3021 TaxID=114890 RepID=A0AC35TR87_9BILA